MPDEIKLHSHVINLPPRQANWFFTLVAQHLISLVGMTSYQFRNIETRRWLRWRECYESDTHCVRFTEPDGMSFQSLPPSPEQSGSLPGFSSQLCIFDCSHFSNTSMSFQNMFQLWDLYEKAKSLRGQKCQVVQLDSRLLPSLGLRLENIVNSK